MNNDKKLLFSGISEKMEIVIKKHLGNTIMISDFCNLDDTDSFIGSFQPDILITAITSDADYYENQIYTLKKISESYHIPFSVIINRTEEELYYFLLKNEISKIITFPASKGSFISFLIKFLSVNDSHEKNEDTALTGSFSETDISLISNLVNQNIIVKNNLKNKIHIETKKNKKGHSEAVKNHRLIEKKLWDAYDNSYFRLFYQPVIDLNSGRLSGFEALIRLFHPEEGMIPPDEFIHVAEKSAIIFPLGLWIIEEASMQIQSWKDKFVFDTPLRINVNLSAKQFIHPELTSHIFEITDKLGIDENDIAFELTESAFMEDMDLANIALLELRSRKFVLYMDDFGTGYSSLSYLMHFPVNVIKIDQSFVKWMHIDEQSETIVKSVIGLAHNLGLKVVAEGTEDISQIDLLKSSGCDYAQGYYFSKPLPADEAGKFISGYFKTR